MDVRFIDSFTRTDSRQCTGEDDAYLGGGGNCGMSGGGPSRPGDVRIRDRRSRTVDGWGRWRHHSGTTTAQYVNRCARCRSPISLEYRPGEPDRGADNRLERRSRFRAAHTLTIHIYGSGKLRHAAGYGYALAGAVPRVVSRFYRPYIPETPGNDAGSGESFPANGKRYGNDFWKAFPTTIGETTVRESLSGKQNFRETESSPICERGCGVQPGGGC